jgi:[ribosomal protein S5]-alanine N-acetyltransferase
MGLVPAVRLLTTDDAPVLAELVTANREYLAPWEPLRGEDYFTVAGQLVRIDNALDGYRQGNTLPCVIVDDTGAVLGRITLNGIVRGPFQSCSVGYWVSQSATGRGLATAALGDIIGLAFGQLGLHRIQAETLLDNVASQRVLARNGFVHIGMAPSYLKIDGRWQDMNIYQVVNEAAS